MKKPSKKREQDLEADKRETMNECDEQDEENPEKNAPKREQSDESDQECQDALSNPRCPYVTQINLHASDLQVIKTALLGDDGTGMRGGIVFEISCLKTHNQISSSWSNSFKPILTSLAVAAITAVATYFLTH